jgi:hypothetical protein
VWCYGDWRADRATLPRRLGSDCCEDRGRAKIAPRADHRSSLQEGDGPDKPTPPVSD